MGTNRSAWRYVFVGTASLLIVSLLVSNVRAQSSSASSMEQCNDPRSAEPQIRGCTELIKSQGYNAKVLAIAYNNRGNAYGTEGQYDLAIQDYDKSINLNPNFAKPLNNR